MNKNLYLAAALLVLAIPATASTPDGQTPSRETICDSQSGAAFGLCNAYCEAMDCDSPAPEASPKACERVLANFVRHTGEQPPCVVSCPCTGQLPLFAAFASGAQAIDTCVSGGGVTSVGAGEAFATVVGNVCSTSDGASVPDLTLLEAESCRELLREAAAAAGTVCRQPE